jgi:hypothetical protein
LLLAQILQGDTIFVNDGTIVTIELPGKIFDARKIDERAQYKLDWNKNSNKVAVLATAKDVRCSGVIIEENKRGHSFILCYKANLQVDADDYVDLSTLKKLGERVNKLQKRQTDQKALWRTIILALQQIQHHQTKRH